MSKINKKEVSKDGWVFIIILSLLMAITSLSVDVYLPAMPIMQQDLKGNIEFTVTGFLIGFSVGQLIWGVVSDHIGRKLPLLIGITLFTIGSIGCALSQTIGEMVVWRIIQALGACTGPMIARAMIRDLYTKTRAAQMLSTLMIIMAIAPIAGPIVGGQIIAFSSWHNIFWLLVVIGIIMIFSISFLPETLKKSAPSTGSMASIFTNYIQLLKNKTFIRFTLCVTFFYLGAYAFIVGSPFVYITYYGISAQHYGWLFSLNIIGILFISFLNRKLVNIFEIKKLLSIATKIASLAAILMGILVYMNIGGIYTIIILMLIIFSTNGIIAACATAEALDSVGEIAGAASALIGSLQYGSGIISSMMLAFFYNGTPDAMIITIVIAVILSGICVLRINRHNYLFLN